MKRKIFICIILSLLVCVGYSQIVQTTSSYTTVTKKTKYISYRGYVELSGNFTKGISGFQLNVVPLGFQCSPYFAFGFGTGITYQWYGKKFEPKEGYTTYYDGGSMSIPFYINFKINILKDKIVIPFIDVAGGGAHSEDLVRGYAHLKVGATYMNKKKTTGLSAFVGMTLLSHDEDSIDQYSYYSAVVYTPCFNVGVRFEFGGASGFNSRPKK